VSARARGCGSVAAETPISERVKMFSYKILPMRADGDIYALYDAAGNQVAMGAYEVCLTLLYLVTHSSLMERPPQHYEEVAPRQRVKSVSGVTEGRAELAAVGKAGVKSLDVPRSGAATAGVKVSASAGRLEVQPPSGRSLESENALEDVLELPSPVLLKGSDYPTENLLDPPGLRRHRAPAPHAPFPRPDAGRPVAGPSEAAGEVGATPVSAERKPLKTYPVARLRDSDVELDTAPYGIFGDTYLSGQPSYLYLYVGLFVVLMIVSALLVWGLLLSR
jgi:hypothetical protein